MMCCSINAVCKMSLEGREFLLAFHSLSELNALKRAFRGVFLPMRQLPACLAKSGCGFALSVTPELLDDVEQAAARLRIGYRLFTIQPALGAARFQLERERENQ